MKIRTCKLRAADEFRAKGDARNYLNGIHINKDFIQATNGYVAIQMKSEVKTRVDVIVRFKGRIPKSAYLTKLEFSKGKSIATHYDGMDQIIGVQLFDIEEGRFPDLRKAIPNEFKVGSSFPLLNAEYLAITHKAFGAAKNKFISMDAVHYQDDNQAVIFEVKGNSITDCGNPLVAIMPMRR